VAAGVRRALEDEDDIRAALVPDAQGIGSGADVVDERSTVDAMQAVLPGRVA
jgi:hypothetical protein